MKLIVDDSIKIYLNKLYLKKIDINDKFAIKKIINSFVRKYDIDISGFIDVKIHVDKNYGIIIEINKELDYFDYFKDELEMNIEIIDDVFLYETDYLEFKNCGNFYKFNDMFYLCVNKINDFKLGKLIENSKIIYGDRAKKIKNESNRVEVIL